MPQDPRDAPSPATGAVVTHVHPFPGLAGGLVYPGDQLLWLEDRAKTPGHLDATEAPFDVIDRVASEAGGSCVTLLLPGGKTGTCRVGSFWRRGTESSGACVGWINDDST